VEAGSPVVNRILNAQEALLPRRLPKHASGTGAARGAEETLTHDDRRWRSFRK
jgi:hypothetical protein